MAKKIRSAKTSSRKKRAPKTRIVVFKPIKAPASLDAIVRQINSLTLYWVGFHQKLHPRQKPQLLCWDKAFLDDATSLEYAGQLIQEHASNNKSCRDAICKKFPPKLTWVPEASPVNYPDEQTYLNAISNWLTSLYSHFESIWKIYFPNTSPTQATATATPASVHEAFDWLALNCKDFVATENQGFYSGAGNTIQFTAIPNPPTQPSTVTPLASLKVIEHGCDRLACYQSDLLSKVSQLSIYLAASENRSGKYGRFGGGK
jgi:hypothetical protein